MQKPKSLNKSIINNIKRRLADGQKKYGGDITDIDPRDWLSESTEEMLDQVVYLTAQHFRMIASREFYFVKMHQAEKLLKEIENDKDSKYSKRAKVWSESFEIKK
tara:strand:+ start:526 stop:840 length:315 start_codon:yes stop_codon:yes gene_type:complete